MPAGRRLRAYRGPYTPCWAFLAVVVGGRYTWTPYVVRGRLLVRAENAAERDARRAAFGKWMASVVRAHPAVPDPPPGFPDLAERAMRLRERLKGRALAGTPLTQTEGVP